MRPQHTTEPPVASSTHVCEDALPLPNPLYSPPGKGVNDTVRDKDTLFVRVIVFDTVGDMVAVNVGVADGLPELVGVNEAVTVSVGVRVLVPVCEGVTVYVGVRVGVPDTVPVLVAVGVCVTVDVDAGVGDGVCVPVTEPVSESVGDTVGVTEGEGVGGAATSTL